MYKQILVPVDLNDPEMAKPAVATAVLMARQSEGSIRLINVIPLTPTMLAKYVPEDFEAQQRRSAEEALAIVAQETGLGAGHVSAAVRQGGVFHEILEEANATATDLIVVSSHRQQRPGGRSGFLGSNAGHVVRYARCSVILVRL